MKPEYEKPIAVPLGEAAKGSGQCNQGSAVVAPLAGATSSCTRGNDPVSFASCMLGDRDV